MTTHSQVGRRAEPVLVRSDKGRPFLAPFGHQKDAISKYAHSDEIALFFEMGCGKSFTTLRIAEEKFLQGDIQGLLVVAPNDVHRQWFDELVRGVDKDHDGVLWQELRIDFEAQCVGGRGGQKELYPFETSDLFKFVSVNVDTFSQPHKWEKVVEWANSGMYMIAIDEATVLKNPSSRRSQRLLHSFNDVRRCRNVVVSSVKKCPVRAVLTGTPVTNGPVDLWAIMEFVKPNFFGRNYYSFRDYYGMFTRATVKTVSASGALREHDVPILLNERAWYGIHACDDFMEAQALFGCSEDTYLTVKHQDRYMGPYKHADELKRLLEPTAMFMRLTDCVDMPAMSYVTRHVGMSDAQKAAYSSMKKELFAEYDGHTMSATNKLVASMRLQQISSGFIVGKRSEYTYEEMFSLDTAYSTDMFDAVDLQPDEVVWLGDTNPKLSALMQDVAECDKPLLILTRYTAEAVKIYELCDKEGYNTGLFTGWKVAGGVEAFKEGKLDVLVANSFKIARGFNLQVAHTTLFYSNTFSMEVRQQAEFRTFRMGQKHPCLYVDYSAAECDETVINALRMKKGMLDYIRDRNIEEVL